MNNKVHIRKGENFCENIEITNFYNGMGINLTEKGNPCPNEHNTSDLYKTSWVTFPIGQAKTIEKTLRFFIDKYEEDIKYGEPQEWRMV